MAELSPSVHDPNLADAHGQLLHAVDCMLQKCSAIDDADILQILPTDQAVTYALGGAMLHSAVDLSEPDQLFVIRHEAGTLDNPQSHTRLFVTNASQPPEQRLQEYRFHPTYRNKTSSAHFMEPRSQDCAGQPVSLSDYHSLLRTVAERTTYNEADSIRALAIATHLFAARETVEPTTVQLAYEFSDQFARDVIRSRHTWRGKPTGR